MWIFISRDPAASPFVLCQEARGGGWARALSASILVHFVILGVMAWPSKPNFVKPNLPARGSGGTSALNVTSLYLPQELRRQTEIHKAQLSLPAARTVRTRINRKSHNALEAEKPKDQVELGSAKGSALEGPISGDEVKPALPLDFQEPTIRRSELPAGLQGDVIVEITIDELGKVTEERLLQGVGHGIDEKVIAAVHDWHFRPATRNGIAIPSKHDVHFHFPS